MAKGWKPLGSDRPFVPYLKSFDATFVVDRGSSRRVHWQRYSGDFVCECGMDRCEHVRLALEELKRIVGNAE